MTKIRKINVSQVEGNDANNTDITEIRPFGETAFYLDTDGNTNKLVLMMIDGARIHQKSKVLSPGILYGSNADSGDGAGLDTIKLIPDATLHNNGSNQYIVIDPTVPNHIHIRAGGAIDSSNADLFLGGENNHVKVSDYGIVTVKANNAIDLNIGSSTYTFSYDEMFGSSFQIPGGIQGPSQTSLITSNGLGISIDGFNSPNTVDIGNISSSTVLRLKDGTGAGNIIVQALGTSLKLQTNGNSTWEFNDNGSLVFPDATTQTTAWTGVASEGTTSTTSANVGYIGMPQTPTSTSYILVAGDQGKHIYVTNAGQTITVPANSTTAFPVGTTIAIIAGPNANPVTIAITSDTMYLGGVGSTGTRTLAAYGMATLVKVDATTWFINGSSLS